MKLKYYLRGLGIGMIVTALILGISFSDRQESSAQTMSDDQIRERAAELGMVDSSELTLAALQNSARQSEEETNGSTAEATGEVENTQEVEATEAPAVTEVPEATEASAVTEAPKATEEPKATEAPKATEVPEATEIPAATEAPKTTEAPATTAVPGTEEQSQTVSITIQRGADSGSVSRQLQEAGLVENAKAFDNYLCNNGYSRSIHPDTYEIAPGTSEEEIAKIITGKH